MKIRFISSHLMWGMVRALAAFSLALSFLAIQQPRPAYAATGTIIIEKVTLPSGGAGFGFTTTGGLDPSTFSLDDGAKQEFDNVTAGPYTVAEEDPSGLGYVITRLVCDDPTSDSTGDTETRTAAIDLTAGETVTCTFTNTLLGTSEIEKQITATNQGFTDPSDSLLPSPPGNPPPVAIGEMATYQVTVHVPYGEYYNIKLSDTMRPGLSFVACTSITGLNTTPTDFSTACMSPTFNVALQSSVDYQRIVTVDLTSDLEVGAGGGTITLIYSAVVLDSIDNNDGQALANSAAFTWEDAPTGGTAHSLGPASATVDVVEPQLQMTMEADTKFIAAGTIVTSTVTIQHTANSHTPAFNVVFTDPIPPQFDPVSGTIDCSGSTTAPSAPLPIDNAGVVTAGWPTLNIGDVAVCTFELQGNDTLTVGEDLRNVAYVVWTSLPVDPGQQNGNVFSTERSYNPNDLLGINNYQVRSWVPFTSLGGIPGTGFAPGVVTALSGQPAVAYNDNLGVSLRIPKLKLDMAIEGVPYLNDVWQVDWLTGVGGWLQGTAFPGLSGNSVIMSHVVTHYGSPGPFARLDALNVGDNIYIMAFGRQYVYQVTKTGNVAPDDISVFKHATKPVLTLITCSKWNAATQTYDGRFVVRAELMAVQPVK